MKRIQGRLHLCTKSIVFEPTDTSRGVIRFPFDKMTITATLDAGSGGTNTIRNSAPGSRSGRSVFILQTPSFPVLIRIHPSISS